MVVDVDGIISQLHLGKHVYYSKDKEQLDAWQANEGYKEEAKLISLIDLKSVLNQLTLHHAVFTEHDIAKLLHKHINEPQEFQSAFIKVKASKQLLSLGLGDDAKERFTIRKIFELENKIQETAESLHRQLSHPVNHQSIQTTIDSYQLSSEQANAICHISNSKGISIIVGLAGSFCT